MITTKQLLGLSLGSLARAIKRAMLEARKRSLYRLADYFKWQQDNGNAGLADTHKRIVRLEAELRDLT